MAQQSVCLALTGGEKWEPGLEQLLFCLCPILVQ
jgi:hypothetical protein